MSVLLDSSSIGELRKDKQLLDKFILKRIQEGMEIYISGIVFDEIVSGNDLQSITERFQIVSELASVGKENESLHFLETVFYVDDPKNIWKIEIKRNGMVNKLPAQPFSRLKLDVFINEQSLLEAKQLISSDLIADSENDKKFVIEQKNLIENIKKSISKDSSIQDYNNFKGLRYDHKFSKGMYGGGFNGLTKKKFQKILNEKYRYKYIRTFLNLAAFMLLRYNLPNKIIVTPKLDKNDVKDIIIAAQASYVDYLITEDTDLIDICTELKRRGLLNYDALRVNDFVKS